MHPHLAEMVMQSADAFDVRWNQGSWIVEATLDRKSGNCQKNSCVYNIFQEQ